MSQISLKSRDIATGEFHATANGENCSLDISQMFMSRDEFSPDGMWFQIYFKESDDKNNRINLTIYNIEKIQKGDVYPFVSMWDAPVGMVFAFGAAYLPNGATTFMTEGEFQVTELDRNAGVIHFNFKAYGNPIFPVIKGAAKLKGSF
ncbi:hypothetical protein OH720_28520 [Pseudomonas sp. WJP1]|uniref:hypothetical protein n=1 Tax=Pseudomonas sp. WJP1 TaxID=2986947 RepID=UPI00234BFDB4|nr:hypothetical protein [Pseudomonas sp. WJP1]WCM50842.1 hypothetical protein OH720_28520 [Pseudomonas sp. WJP1]